MEPIYVTLTGMNHYLGLKPYKIGRVVRLVKEPDNAYDNEAIRAELPYIDIIGYVANSANTVYAGTCSAGRLYDKIGDVAYAQIAFITHSQAIALLLPPEAIKDTPSDATIPSGSEETAAGVQAPGTPLSKIGF